MEGHVVRGCLVLFFANYYYYYYSTIFFFIFFFLLPAACSAVAVYFILYLLLSKKKKIIFFFLRRRGEEEDDDSGFVLLIVVAAVVVLKLINALVVLETFYDLKFGERTERESRSRTGVHLVHDLQEILFSCPVVHAAGRVLLSISQREVMSTVRARRNHTNYKMASSNYAAVEETSRCCLWDKPRTFVVSFRPFHLREAMVYHLAYHYSLGLHINHLLFLHTYGIGVGISTLAIGGASYFYAPSWILLAFYTVYVLFLGKKIGAAYISCAVPAQVYAIFLLKSSIEATWSVDSTLSSLSLNVLFGGVGIGIVIASFVFQLMGHCAHERFGAPPNLLHGFVCAPFLEFVSCCLRTGLIDTTKATSAESKNTFFSIWDEVDLVRNVPPPRD